MTRKSHGFAAAAVAAAALLASLPAPAAQAATKHDVTIGVIAPVDAGLTEFGRGIRDSVLLAVQQAKDQGALKGWSLSVRVLDDSSNPDKGAAAAKTLAKQKDVVAVVGPYNSGVALLAEPVLDKAGLALVSPSNTLTSLTVGEDPTQPNRQWKTYFRVVGQDARQAEFLAAQARRLGFRTAAVVSETKAVSKGLADAFAVAFKNAGGTIGVQQTVPDNAAVADFTTFVGAAAPMKPDVVFFGGEYNVAANLRTAATTAGITAPVMGGDGMNDPTYITGAGTSAAGTYASGVGVPLARLTGAADFVRAYQSAGYSSRPTDYGPYAYDAANAVIAVLAKQLKGKDALPSGIRAAVVKGLQSTNRNGITGRVWFDKFGDTKNPTFTLYQVQGSPPAWVAAT